MSADTTQNTLADKLILSIEFVDALVVGAGLPANNIIGTILLAQLLDSALESAGQLLSQTDFAGPLNQSFCVFSVRDFKESTRVICQALKKIPMSSAHVFHYDHSEEALRCIFPAAGDVVNKDEILKKIRAASDWMDSAINGCQKWSQALEKIQAAQKSGAAPKL